MSCGSRMQSAATKNKQGVYMSLRFIFGPSGAGKSRYIYEEIIQRAKQSPKQNFLVLVPDQFTMQTQKECFKLWQTQPQDFRGSRGQPDAGTG